MVCAIETVSRFCFMGRASVRARPLAWEQMERDIKEDGFARLSASLLFGPFDEVMQSTFFLPWVRFLCFSAPDSFFWAV